MTREQRTAFYDLLDLSMLGVYALIIGVIMLVTAGVASADQLDSAGRVASSFNHVVDVAAGKSVLWLALSGLCLTMVALITLIVVMFKVISKGIDVLDNLKTAINSRPCWYGHGQLHTQDHTAKREP